MRDVSRHQLSRQRITDVLCIANVEYGGVLLAVQFPSQCFCLPRIATTAGRALVAMVNAARCDSHQDVQSVGLDFGYRNIGHPVLWTPLPDEVGSTHVETRAVPKYI